MSRLDVDNCAVSGILGYRGGFVLYWEVTAYWGEEEHSKVPLSDIIGSSFGPSLSWRTIAVFCVNRLCLEEHFWMSYTSLKHRRIF